MNKNFSIALAVSAVVAAAYYIGKKAAAPVVVKPEKDETLSKVVDSITSFGKKVVDGLKESETYAEKQVKGAEEIKDSCEESWKDYLKEFDKKLNEDLDRMHEKCSGEKADGVDKNLSSLEESELLGEWDLVKLAADTAVNGKKCLDMAINLAMLEFTDEKAVKYLSTSLEVIPYTDDQTRERIKAAEKLWQSKGKYLEYCKKYETFIAEWKKAAPSKAREIWEIAKEAKKTVTK